LALEELTNKFKTQLLLIESGGDNLAANYSRELADYIIYVIDVAGGDKVRRRVFQLISSPVQTKGVFGGFCSDPSQGWPRHHTVRPVGHQQDRPCWRSWS